MVRAENLALFADVGAEGQIFRDVQNYSCAATFPRRGRGFILHVQVPLSILLETNMIRYRAAVLCVLGSAAIAAAFAADSPAPAAAEAKSTYSYATNGVWDNQASGIKLLLDKSNLGGEELEAAELTLPAGTNVGSHTHQSVEIIYVVSGTYGHEVNGKLYRLTPGMVGIVRPGDHVRHLVPKSGPAKLLIVWAPPGEVARVFRQGKHVPVEPVPEAKSLEP
jgi:quercetin dioxygenase-like cupin family protein